MRRKTEWILKGLFLGLGILSVLLPVFLVRITGNAFSKTQTCFFLSASLLSFLSFLLTQILLDYKREKKINVFCIAASVLLMAVLVGVWL